MNKKFLECICWDMDGTIADLYNYPDWLDHIESHNTEPFLHCKELLDLKFTINILNELRSKYGVKINIITWLPKKRRERGEKEYAQEVIKAKKYWLAKHEFPYDEFIPIKYGKLKHEYISCSPDGRAVLIDDNSKICKEWNKGRAIHAQREDVNRELFKILDYHRKNC